MQTVITETYLKNKIGVGTIRRHKMHLQPFFLVAFGIENHQPLVEANLRGRQAHSFARVHYNEKFFDCLHDTKSLVSEAFCAYKDTQS